jgi:hypothetical protein
VAFSLAAAWFRLVAMRRTSPAAFISSISISSSGSWPLIVVPFAAAASAACSAYARRAIRIFGHDPAARLQHTKARREEIDALMGRATTSAWAHIPTEAQHRGPNGQK